jgi:hypothetical protein
MLAINDQTLTHIDHLTARDLSNGAFIGIVVAVVVVSFGLYCWLTGLVGEGTGGGEEGGSPAFASNMAAISA